MATRLAQAAVVAVAVAAGFAAPVARAAPPDNDNRAAAAQIPSFPATVPGTLAEATVERLDPQVSNCGQIDATVWYRIDQSPDGAIVIDVQGAFAPVIRVYRANTSALKEIDCASAASGQRAQIAFESTRGASYLVIVGRKPNTSGTEFSLGAKLFLPPPNDSWKSAQAIGALPAKLSATTLGATADPSDPESCSLAGGTVWYSIPARSDGRLAFQLTAAGDFDAVVAVQERSRSERHTLACARTDRRGNLSLPVDVEKGGTYLVAVGNLDGSPPGDFVLQTLAAQAPERAPGARLAGAGVHSSVNGLTDVNDMWWRLLRPGTTYRISFHTKGCPSLVLSLLRAHGGPLLELPCNSYRTFTPGPDGGGRYVFEVRAPRTLVTQSYSLKVAKALDDDVGLGVELANLTTKRGSLSPAGVDVIDRYHFDVPETSDVRIMLRGGSTFGLTLVTENGRRVSVSPTDIHRLLVPGRYVLAVGAVPGSPAGRYAVTLVERRLTSTVITASSATTSPGASVTLTAQTSPTPDGGKVEVQIDRFDPLGGWTFNRRVTLGSGGGSFAWVAPALGRWRVHAVYLGNSHFNRSASSYSYVLVK